jgi:type VI secretion system secreted protein VgrG
MNDQPDAADFIQASRILKVVSPLGEDQLLPERVTIEEGVSSLFEIRLSVRAKREAVKPEELIGRLVDVSIEVQQGEEEGDAVRRPFNGLVTELNEGPPVTRGMRSYSMVLRPQMWLLSRRSDCRIWMDKTSIDIVQTLLSEHGLPAPDVSGIISPPPVQHYSVQWNETDLAYLTRRFEEDGLFYWFSHEDGAHRLNVADSASSWTGPSASAQGEGKVRLAQGSSDRNHINEWTRRFSYVPGQRAGADWNFETPQMVPGTMTPSLVQMPDAIKRELYEYPARISSVAEAERAAKLRMQSSEADHDRVHGESTSRVLEAGRRFTPYEVAHPDHTYEEHVIIKARHSVVDRSYETNSNEPEYGNSFEAVPARVSMTPHRSTKRPRIEGNQVAIVAGPSGEEIHPDQYGRIKLWFPWDRKAKKDGSDTCWVRVAQNWAGGGWGGQIIPRIGMEVMVAFVDGDPDRPLVTGIVPNTNNKVPYDLPANKTKSSFRTNTHKGHGFNELSFEDDSGREEVFLQAQKDMHVGVKNNFVQYTNANHHQQVGMSETRVVLGWADYFYNQNLRISTGRNLFQMVGDPDAVMSVMSANFVDRANFYLPFGQLANQTDLNNHHKQGSMITVVSGDISTATSSNYTLDVSGNTHASLGGGFSAITGKDYMVSADLSVMTSAGKSIVFAAGEAVVIKCGESELSMSKDGKIKIKGNLIEIEGSSNIKQKSAKIELN